MNPYKRWLGIRSDTTDPDYFELLGIDRDEYDSDVIKAAAKLQLAKLQKHRFGKYSEACEKIIQRVNRAYGVLTDLQKRKKYIIRLAQKKGLPVPAEVEHLESKLIAKPRKSRSSALRKWETQKSHQSFLIRFFSSPTALFTTTALILATVGGIALDKYFSSTEAPKIANQRTASDQDDQPANDQINKPLVESDEPTMADSHADPSSPEQEKNVLTQETLNPKPNANLLNTSNAEAEKELAIPNAGTDDGELVKTVETDSSQAMPSETHPSEPARVESDSNLEPHLSDSKNFDDELVTTTASQTLPVDARGVLATHCASCHSNGAEEGGFDFVMNRDALVSANYIIPGNPNASPLLLRMKSSETPMPPKGQSSRPTPEEIKTIGNWIRDGAKNFAISSERAFVSTDQIYNAISADLDSVNREKQKYIRYFSFQHLANAGYADSELETSRLALQKLLNSLSWHRKLIQLKPIHNSTTVFRIDLRSLKWRRLEWSLVESRYEYAVAHDSNAALSIRKRTACEVPVVRGDWFVANGSRPPLYHDLLQLPDTDVKLEEILQVDIENNLGNFETIRAGFTRSGVSQNNRLIERHQSIFGTYWKSYDFSGNTGRKNLFEFPFGPGETLNDFDHDGGEIIFTLPNGMLGFMLVDQSGQRIDKGPTAIVSDLRQPDRAVVNGVSCMSCHYGGFIPKDDEIREHVLANKAAYPRVEEILALFPESKNFRKYLVADTKAYLNVLKQIQLADPSRSEEPVVMVANRFGNEVNVRIAAAELGIQDAELAAKIRSLSDLDLVRQVGPLSVNGGMLKRETFGEIYLKLVVEMGLGRKAFVKAPRVARNGRAVGTSSRTTLPDKRTKPDLRFGDDAQSAETALSNAIRLVQQSQLDQAAAEFENAIRLAPNLQFRARAYEEAMDVFAEKGKIQAIVDGFVDITTDLQGTETIAKARDQFFKTVIKYLVSKQRNPTSSRSWCSWDRGTSWRISDHAVPLSVAGMISTAFEDQLKKIPGHEPSLKILETHYRSVSKNDKRLYEVLVQLRKIVNDRGEKLDFEGLRSLSSLYLKNGEPAKSAMIHQTWNSRSRSRVDFFNTGYLDEAHAWSVANEPQKALAALKKAEDYVLKKNGKIRANNLQRMQYIYEKLGHGGKMIPLIEKAIKNGGSKYDIEKLQAMLRSVLENSADSGGTTNMANAETNKLLDPKQGFRAEAESYENRRQSSPQSTASNMTRAATNWYKAGEEKKAMAALDKAAKALKNVDRERDLSNYYQQIADAYLAMDENQLALNNYLAALNSTASTYTVKSLHKKVVDLMELDSSLKVPKKMLALTDPNFATKQAAAATEKRSKPGRPGYISSQIDAAKKWLEADEIENFKRCALNAAKSIEKLKPTDFGGVEVRWTQHEMYHRQLAEVYAQAELYPEAIRQFVKAISRTSFDHQAVSYHKKIKNICEQNDLPLPEIPKEVAVKLDPLNKYRVEAREYEVQAKEYPNQRVRYLKYAAKAWFEAKEETETLRVTSQWARLVRKLDKGDLEFELNCDEIAKIYEEFGELEKAIQFLELARDAQEHDFMKEDFQKRINKLKSKEANN